MRAIDQVQVYGYTLTLYEGGFVRIYLGDQTMADAIPGQYGPAEGVSYDRYTGGGYLPGILTVVICDLFVSHGIWEGHFP